ncbi:MAG: hypothetical protein AAF514_02485, partial [Verrucomicrobiota bacterium]
MRLLLLFSGLSVLIGGFTVVAEDEALAGALVYDQDFDKAKPGEAPDDLFVIDGDFVVAEEEGNRFLELPGDPIQENGFLFGKSSKGAARVEVSIRGKKKRRSYPRFGIGLHGISGFRLRVVPGNDEIELLKDEEVVTNKAFDWKSNAWCHLALEVSQSGGHWVVKGWAWHGKVGDRPETPVFSHRAEGPPGQGKASAWGSPYSGQVIQFDDLKSFSSSPQVK